VTVIQLGRLEVETPDHVVLRYDLAGGGNRGFAALVDFIAASLLVAGGFIGWTIVAAVLPTGSLRPLQGVLVMALFVIGWSYFIVLEWLWEGQTLGKRMFGLRVISADGSPASFTAVLIRNLVRVVDFLPAFYGFGLLAIVLSSRSQRLGDLAAGTFVVRAPRPRLDLLALRTAPAAGEGAAADVRGLPGELQRLVREFVAREATLGETHRRAIAARIAPALRARMPDVTETDDVELVRSVARALRSSGERGDRLRG
jgi:uncharacterized RDD family membrane protein YckC